MAGIATDEAPSLDLDASLEDDDVQTAGEVVSVSGNGDTDGDKPTTDLHSWESRREELQLLYMEQGWTLRKTRKHMKEKGFHKTEKMYKTQFRKWGFLKNVGRKELAAMVRTQSRRRAVGKATVFRVKRRVFNLDARLHADGITEADLEGTSSALPASIRAFTPPTLSPSLPTLSTPPPISTPRPSFFAPSPTLSTPLSTLSLPPPIFSTSPSTSSPLPSSSSPLLSTSSPLPAYREDLLEQPYIYPEKYQALRAALHECADVLETHDWSNYSCLVDAARSMGIGFALISRRHIHLGFRTIHKAFSSLLLLPQRTSLDYSMYFLLISMIWPDEAVNREMLSFLAALPSDETAASRTVNRLFQEVSGYIKEHGADSYFNVLASCIDDFLAHMSHSGHVLSIWDVMEWTQDAALYSHKGHGANAHAFSTAAHFLRVVGKDDQADRSWGLLKDLLTAIHKDGVGHARVLDIADRLLIQSQEGGDREHVAEYFQFHANSAMAMRYKTWWDQRTRSPHPGFATAMHYLESAERAAAKCPSLAPAARLANWFVMEEWLREVGREQEAGIVRLRWERWVGSPEMEGP